MKTRMAIAGVLVALLIGGVIAWRVIAPPSEPVTEAEPGPAADVPPDPGPAADVPPDNDRIWAANPTVKGHCDLMCRLSSQPGTYDPISAHSIPISPPSKPSPLAAWVPSMPIAPSKLTTATLLAVVRQSPEKEWDESWLERRLGAIEALGSRHDQRDAISPVISDALIDGEPAIRSAAIEALRNLNFDDRTGSAALDRALKTEPDDVRFWFAQQVRQASSARHGVESGLLVPNLDIRIKAVELLARMGDEGKPSVPILRRLGDTCDDAELRGAIGLALSQLDGQGPIPGLAKALKDSDPIIRGRAALRLGRMGKAAVPALRAALKENDADVRASTLGALGRIGAEAGDAVPDVKPLLKDENPLVRKLAADALRSIDH